MMRIPGKSRIHACNHASQGALRGMARAPGAGALAEPINGPFPYHPRKPVDSRPGADYTRPGVARPRTPRLGLGRGLQRGGEPA